MPGLPPCKILERNICFYYQKKIKKINTILIINLSEKWVNRGEFFDVRNILPSVCYKGRFHSRDQCTNVTSVIYQTTRTYWDG